MVRMIYTVTVGEHTTRVRVSDPAEVIDRAIRKLYGKHCIWQPDSGVPGMGQVFRRIRPPLQDYTSVTRRVRLTVTPPVPRPLTLTERLARARA